MRAGVLEPSKWADVAAGLGLDGVSLAVQAQSRSGVFAAFTSPAACAAACRAYVAAGVTPHLMFWPRPEAGHARQLLNYLSEVYASVPELGSADLDAEEQWTRSPLRYGSGQSVAHLLRTDWPSGLPLAVNGITAALPRILDLVRVADVLWPQAYTANKPSQTGTPGARQEAVYTRWREQAHDSQTINMGLAAYDQEGAGGLSHDAAMVRAYNAASIRVEAIRYWSLQELAGGKDAAFVRERCSEIRQARRSHA